MTIDHTHDAEAKSWVASADYHADFPVQNLPLGVWIAGHNDLGQPVPIADAWDRVGGMALLNDWPARDMQA